MGKLVWKIRLFCAHRVCVDTHSRELSGAEQVPGVVLCSAGALPLQGQPLLGCTELLNPFGMQAAEWEPVWLRRLAGKQDCPASMEATTCVQWD